MRDTSQVSNGTLYATSTNDTNTLSMTSIEPASIVSNPQYALPPPDYEQLDVKKLSKLEVPGRCSEVDENDLPTYENALKKWGCS